MDFAWPSVDTAPKRDKADHLPAENPDLQKIPGLKLLQQQTPHHVENVLAKPSTLARIIVKVCTVNSEFRTQFQLKMTQAIKIKLPWVRKTFIPIWPCKTDLWLRVAC